MHEYAVCRTHWLAAFSTLGTAAYFTFVIHPTRSHGRKHASQINLHRIESDEEKCCDILRIRLQSTTFDLRAALPTLFLRSSNNTTNHQSTMPESAVSQPPQPTQQTVSLTLTDDHKRLRVQVLRPPTLVLPTHHLQDQHVRRPRRPRRSQTETGNNTD
jgi:hypothetical protein